MLVPGGARLGVVTALVVALIGTPPAPAMAQTFDGPITNIEEARARQAELFGQLRANPDDLELMAEYARLSIRLEDFEAAISTMERMLIYRQDLPQVRRELGVAYFNIGSYAAAQLYLTQVLEDPTLPPEIRENVELYLAEIDNRTRVNRITDARVAAGVVYSTNANFGPDEVEAFGLTVAPTDGEEEGDVGLRAFASIVHDYDFQGTNSDFWRTEASAIGIRYLDVSEGDLEFVNLRTGPQISLDQQEFGPKIRPFLSVGHLSVDDKSLYFEGAGGVQFRNPISNQWSSFAELTIGYRNFTDGDQRGSDAFRVLVDGGMAYIPARDLTLRGSIVLEQEVASDGENTNTEFGIRLAGNYDYEPGFDWTDSRWSLSGSLDLRGRIFRTGLTSVGFPDATRRDFDAIGRLAHIFGITQKFGIQADVSGIYRNSSNGTFDLENVTIGLSALYKL